MTDPRLEQALRDLEETANNFAIRLISMAQVRAQYVEQIKEMSNGIRDAAAAGELSVERGAQIANQMRNEIMEMQRGRDLDLGRALAQRMKSQGITFEEALVNAMAKLKLAGRPFQQLSGTEQGAVFAEVIESAGRAQKGVTEAIPKLRWGARGLWIATVLIAAYNIGTSENPWWQTGRETASIGGGVGGGFVGGLTIGAVGGVWAGPIGIAVGALVGGFLGAVLADRAYVEAAGTSDARTRNFVARFTSMWTGVDEDGIARALANEQSSKLDFVNQVFIALDEDYYTDGDDVALAYVNLIRRDRVLAQTVKANGALRKTLTRLMKQGWTSPQEQQAIDFLARP